MTLREQDLVDQMRRLVRTSVPARLRRPLRKIYLRAPFSWRMSGVCRRTCRFLERSQRWSPERVERYQLERLIDVVGHAFREVPGCRRRFVEHGVDPRSVRSLEDLRRLPFLTKEDLRESPEQFVARDVPPERLQYVISGGTTGAPVGFHHLAGYNDEVAQAFRLVMWRRIGYTPECRALDLTASFSGPPLRRVRDRNVLYVSISSLHPRFYPAVRDEICAFQPEFIIGFPSTAGAFAQLVEDGERVRALNVRGVITASEVMYEPQRRTITRVFGCRILEWYGLAEYAGFAAGCEQSDDYHFFPEAGCMELVGGDGEPVTAEGEEGEIVLTGFYNRATPFIRYRTGDRAVAGRDGCDRCGRNYPTIRRISGRTLEFLVARDGRLIPGSALNDHSGLFARVWAHQYCQEIPGEVILNLVRKDSFTRCDAEAIRGELLGKLGPGISLEVRVVEEIPRTPRGKHRAIVQRLPLPGHSGPGNDGRVAAAASGCVDGEAG